MKGFAIKTDTGHIVTVYYVAPTEQYTDVANKNNFSSGKVKKGQLLGYVQNISDYHNKNDPSKQYGMTNHVHVQVKDKNGKIVDPAVYFGLNNMPVAEDNYYKNPYFNSKK